MSASWGTSEIREKAINEYKAPSVISCPTPQTYYRHLSDSRSLVISLLKKSCKSIFIHSTVPYNYFSLQGAELEYTSRYCCFGKVQDTLRAMVLPSQKQTCFFSLCESQSKHISSYERWPYLTRTCIAIGNRGICFLDGEGEAAPYMLLANKQRGKSNPLPAPVEVCPPCRALATSGAKVLGFGRLHSPWHAAKHGLSIATCNIIFSPG